MGLYQRSLGPSQPYLFAVPLLTDWRESCESLCPTGCVGQMVVAAYENPKHQNLWKIFEQEKVQTKLMEHNYDDRYVKLLTFKEDACKVVEWTSAKQNRWLAAAAWTLKPSILGTMLWISDPCCMRLEISAKFCISASWTKWPKLRAITWHSEIPIKRAQGAYIQEHNKACYPLRLPYLAGTGEARLWTSYPWNENAAVNVRRYTTRSSS